MIMPYFLIVSFSFGQLLTLLGRTVRWSLLDVFALFVSVLWLIRFMRSRIRVFPKLFIAAAIFAVCAVAPRAGEAQELLYIGRWAAYAGIYAYVILDRHRIRWKMALYLSGFLLACLGLFQLLTYPDLRNLMYLGWDPHYERVFATLFDPNFAGILFVLTLLLGFSFWPLSKKRTWMLWSTQAIVFVAFLLTYSRSAYLAFVAGIITWLWQKRSYRLLIAVVSAFAVVILLLSGKGEGQNLFRQVSSQARVGSAVTGWNRFLSSPVFGTGFTHTSESRAGGVDASLLYVLSSGGLVAFAAYGYLFWEIIILGFSDVFFLSAIAALLINSLFINSLFYPWVMAWVWVIAALTENRRPFKTGR